MRLTLDQLDMAISALGAVQKLRALPMER